MFLFLTLLERENIDDLKVSLSKGSICSFYRQEIHSLWSLIFKEFLDDYNRSKDSKICRHWNSFRRSVPTSEKRGARCHLFVYLARKCECERQIHLGPPCKNVQGVVFEALELIRTIERRRRIKLAKDDTRARRSRRMEKC